MGREALGSPWGSLEQKKEGLWPSTGAPQELHEDPKRCGNPYVWLCQAFGIPGRIQCSFLKSEGSVGCSMIVTTMICQGRSQGILIQNIEYCFWRRDNGGRKFLVRMRGVPNICIQLVSILDNWICESRKAELKTWSCLSCKVADTYIGTQCTFRKPMHDHHNGDILSP